MKYFMKSGQVRDKCLQTNDNVISWTYYSSNGGSTQKRSWLKLTCGQVLSEREKIMRCIQWSIFEIMGHIDKVLRLFFVLGCCNLVFFELIFYGCYNTVLPLWIWYYMILFLFKQVNWKYNPGVKFYKFKIIYTKLVHCWKSKLVVPFFKGENNFWSHQRSFPTVQVWIVGADAVLTCV